MVPVADIIEPDAIEWLKKETKQILTNRIDSLPNMIINHFLMTGEEYFRAKMLGYVDDRFAEIRRISKLRYMAGMV